MFSFIIKASEVLDVTNPRLFFQVMSQEVEVPGRYICIGMRDDRFRFKKKNDKCSKCSFLRHSPTTRSPKLGSYDLSFLPRTPRSFKHSASFSITDELIPTLWRRLEVLRRRCVPILDTFCFPIFRLVFKKKMMKPYPQKNMYWVQALVRGG